MIVEVPTPLLSYTSVRTVEAGGGTVGELLDDLERRHPGIRFRIIDEQDAVRPHMRIFVNGEQVFDLAAKVQPTDRVQILQALSGG